jgi:hypothetical protein
MARSDMREIALTKGKVALVDDEDFEVLSEYKWRAKCDGRTYYAARTIRHLDGFCMIEQMHRVILARMLGRPLVKGEQVDHVDGDGLNNQHENLRLATSAQNKRNCRRHTTNPTSKYLGVCWRKDRQRWRAQIQIDGKQLYFGHFDGEFEAALAREQFIDARPELHARSNFPSTLWDM